MSFDLLGHQPSAVLCSSRAENTAPNGKIHVLAELIKTPLASTTGRVDIVFLDKKVQHPVLEDPKRAWLVCLFRYKQVKTVKSHLHCGILHCCYGLWLYHMRKMKLQLVGLGPLGKVESIKAVCAHREAEKQDADAGAASLARLDWQGLAWS